MSITPMQQGVPVSYDRNWQEAMMLTLNSVVSAVNGESGSFTPIVKGVSSAGVGTYSLQQGSYVKYGNIVFFTLEVVWTGHTGTGDMKVTGLPYALNIGGGLTSPVTLACEDIALTLNNVPMAALLVDGETNVYPYQTPVGGGAKSIFAMSAAGSLNIGGSYKV